MVWRLDTGPMLFVTSISHAIIVFLILKKGIPYQREEKRREEKGNSEQWRAASGTQNRMHLTHTEQCLIANQCDRKSRNWEVVGIFITLT
jgi:hypothetical protein